jgi:hypothetical protein
VQITRRTLFGLIPAAAAPGAQEIDRRARELERRTVRSEYLAAIQCRGSPPPP